jgi:deazaflavin-dependent oxidoreductase (nitroreductase family)
MSTARPTSPADWNKQLIDHFRANNGKVTEGYFAGRQLLLLTTTGAKSGRPSTTPLAFTRDDGHIVIVASKGGAPSHPAWYHNLVANPIVTVEADGETFKARATPVHDQAERRRLYDQHSDLHQGFAEYESKTTRQIPVILLDRIPD